MPILNPSYRNTIRSSRLSWTVGLKALSLSPPSAQLLAIVCLIHFLYPLLNSFLAVSSLFFFFFFPPLRPSSSCPSPLSRAGNSQYWPLCAELYCIIGWRSLICSRIYSTNKYILRPPFIFHFILFLFFVFVG
jgi:hypothetical protein